MADRPAFFAFYPGDFAGDILVEAMTTLQVGAYILLLCKAWQADPPASLPNDDAILARLARLSPAEWSEVKAGVLSPFSLGTDDRWHQKRLRQEYEKASALIRERSKAGKNGADSRWQTHSKRMAKPMAKPMRSQCDGNGNQRQSQNQKEDKTTTASVGQETPFDPFKEAERSQKAFVAAWNDAGLKRLERLNHALKGLLSSALNDPDWARDYPAALKRAGEIPFLATGIGRQKGPLDPYDFLRDGDLVRRILSGVHDPRPAEHAAPPSKANRGAAAAEAAIARSKQSGVSPL